MTILKLNQESVNKSVKVLKDGGVVIFPTDTVYGFLAKAENKKAVEKIYRIKKRPKSKPLAVFVKDFKMAKGLAEIDKKQEKILKSKWPGKYTYVLKRRERLKIYDGGKNSIALRIPKYNFLNKLLKKINKPLVQTSVNISGKLPLIKISDIIEQFNKSDILIIDGGNLKKSKPSEIFDLAGDKINILRK